MKSFLDRFRRKGTDDGAPKQADSPVETVKEAGQAGYSPDIKPSADEKKPD